MFDGEFPKWVKTDLFGGRGEVSVQDLLGRAAMPPFAAILACELAPSGKVGAHHQTGADEIVICIGGNGTISVDSTPRPFVPGVVAYLALGQLLAIENGSATEKLQYFIIKATQKSPPA
jgi:quercetin dioxygenase-like cupin family protein